jgi:hypothetical protein
VDSVVVFEGMCDASGAIPIDERRFAIADDEENEIRVYDAERGGPPLAAVPLLAWKTLRRNSISRQPRG